MAKTQATTVPTPRRWLGRLAAALLGVVLLVAVWGKAIDPAAFAEQIHLQGLDRLLPAGAMALLALAIEAGLGTALLLGLRRPWVLVPALLLIAFFLSLTGRAYWLSAHGRLSGDAASCGCFGNLVERSPAAAFWEDALLMGPLVLLSFLGRPRRHPQRGPATGLGSAGGRGAEGREEGMGSEPVAARAAVAALAALGAAVFAWRAPELALDNLATRLRPGVEISSLCAGAGGNRVCLDSVVPDLRKGEHLVIVADLADPALARDARALSDFASAPGAPGVWILSTAEESKRNAFYWRSGGPTFHINEAPPELLRPLYRKLPRSFRVRDGRVTATWSGLPPLDLLLKSSGASRAEFRSNQNEVP